MAPPTGPSQPDQDYAARAVAAYTAMRHYFAVPRQALFRETYPAGWRKSYAHHWPFSQAMAATIDLAGLPGIGDEYAADLLDLLRRGLPHYWDAGAYPPAYDSYVRAPLGRGGDKFFDDNHWTGLNLVRVYRLTGDEAALERARQLFAFAVSGWDHDPGHPAPGGVYWTQQWWNRDRNTVSNAPSAELGLRLHAIAAERGWPDAPHYLDWARRMYGWVEAHLRAPNGLYWDHIDLGGSIERTQWSYNQGTMIGAGVLLWRATGEAVHLARAEETAEAALVHYAGDGYLGQDPDFNAIYFRNLLLLHGATTNGALRRAIRAAMAGHADRVWDDPAIHQRTGLFSFRPGPVKLLDQAAMIELFACLAWDERRYDLIA
jgi:hypothetical protein